MKTETIDRNDGADLPGAESHEILRKSKWIRERSGLAQAILEEADLPGGRAVDGLGTLRTLMDLERDAEVRWAAWRDGAWTGGISRGGAEGAEG